MTLAPGCLAVGFLPSCGWTISETSRGSAPTEKRATGDGEMPTWASADWDWLIESSGVEVKQTQGGVVKTGGGAASRREKIDLDSTLLMGLQR